MKTLHVRIKAQYLDAINKGAKTTEYRDMTDYWIRRLMHTEKYGKAVDEELRRLVQEDENPSFVDWTHIHFHCGKLQAVYEIVEIKKYAHYNYFAIKLGNRVS